MKAIIKKSDAAEPFTFVFEDGGKTVIRSENYKEKRAAVNGVESVKKNCDNDGRYELKTATNGKFFFNLKASNGQVLGTSSLYATEADRTAAMTALKGAASAAVEDLAG